MKLNLETIKKPRIEMLPLIDIVFLLLVFFIYAMLSMAVHRGLPVTLPTSTTSNIDKKLLLSVTIKADGPIYVDEERVTLGSLSEVLKSRIGEGEPPGVLLFADRTINYQDIFRVLDAIRMSGIRRISLQSEEERQK